MCYCAYSFYTEINSKHYLRKINYHFNNNYDFNDYEDNLIKTENKLMNEIYRIMTNSDSDSDSYEFNINCYPFLNNHTCEEYIELHYNMTLKQQESNIINYMMYTFNNITIIKKDEYNTCCNTYQLYW